MQPSQTFPSSQESTPTLSNTYQTRYDDLHAAFPTQTPRAAPSQLLPFPSAHGRPQMGPRKPCRNKSKMRLILPAQPSTVLGIQTQAPPHTSVPSFVPYQPQPSPGPATAPANYPASWPAPGSAKYNPANYHNRRCDGPENMGSKLYLRGMYVLLTQAQCLPRLYDTPPPAYECMYCRVMLFIAHPMPDGSQLIEMYPPPLSPTAFMKPVPLV